MLGSLFITPWSALLLLAYPLQFLRIWLRVRKAKPMAPAAAYAFFVILGKWPELWGQALFLIRLIGGREHRIIEYK